MRFDFAVNIMASRAWKELMTETSWVERMLVVQHAVGGREIHTRDRIDYFESVAGETQDFLFAKDLELAADVTDIGEVVVCTRAIGGNLVAEHKWLYRRNEKPPGGPAALLRMAGAGFRPDGANGGGLRPAG